MYSIALTCSITVIQLYNFDASLYVIFAMPFPFPFIHMAMSFELVSFNGGGQDAATSHRPASAKIWDSTKLITRVSLTQVVLYIPADLLIKV
jgi:hypothetical protein